MKNLRPISISLLLLCLCVLSFFVYKTELEKKEVKDDLIELSNIKYGLFNVDEWKKILAEVTAKKIEEFEVTDSTKVQMKPKISGFLNKVIGDFEITYYKKNSKTLGGFFRNAGAKAFNIFDELKENVPTFTNQILAFLDDPANKQRLKIYLTDKLNDYADNTFAKMDYSLRDSLIKKYNCQDRSAALSVLNSKFKILQNKSDLYKYILAFFAALVAILILCTKKASNLELILMLSTSFLLLILGLMLPMIEIDARVSNMRMSLLGEQINFDDQVLYYKSKSILEVVKLMLTQGGFDLLIVGILVLIFSVLFPLSKLVASVCLTLSPGLESNKIIRFLVHKIGKWSMADVMVVAIFMSYVGFSGILTEQLNQLDNLSSKLEVLTTNKSSLQIGFFAFTSFVLLSLLITNKLKSRNAENHPIN
ncbi:MAG: paraquat-inducible protein A [Bacteroidia bacterium]|nr:paraquat-inducible protein A [Bacteroidia bacterium]